MLQVNSILWPFDDSDSSVRALKTAVELAKQYDAKLYGLHVVPQVPVYTDTAVPLTSFDIEKYEQQLKDTAEKTLKKIVAEKVPEGVNVEPCVVMGKPSDAILNFAKEMKVDLIVMATHARGGISHLLIGSVTEDTIRRSEIPILVVPDPDSRT
jgi:nucleotide-binding universal stress UspA family protein